MKKFLMLISVSLIAIAMLIGCSNNSTYKDGTYSAEFKDFDSRGYKSFMKITVTNNTVSDIVFDGVNKQDDLRNNDADYAKEMEAVQETYPEKFSADLINQYMDTQDIEKVDAIAGATYSSESFIALFKALEKPMQDGDETLIQIDNIKER